MNHEFMDALEQLEKEKHISKEILLDAVETALASAYKRDQKVAQSIEVRVDPKTGDFHVYTHRTVVEEVEDDKNEITLEDALKINPIYELGDLVEFEIFPKEFGRIAAQTAKQVVVQRIREAERSIIYDEFVNKVGELFTGIVQRFEQRNIFIDLGRIEGILPANEQIPNERYEQGTRLKTFVVEVKKTTKGPQVLLSRTRPGLLKRLFENEVPEIHDGLVEIKSVSREPGYRSKVAVYSRDPQIDPVGSCVGARGIRVQMIVRELKGEKIDVVPWSNDPIEFIINALSPAKVSEVKILPSKKMAIVIVPDYQLSLAIGREGQNARLAAKLTGWKIDIKSESQAMEHTGEIEKLVRDEIGFRELTVTPTVSGDEIEQPFEKADVIKDDKQDPVQGGLDNENVVGGSLSDPDVDEEIRTEDELEKVETETYDYELEEEEEAAEEEEEIEVVTKKKPKKTKVAKQLARIELDDELVAVDDSNYFFDNTNKEIEKSKEIDKEVKVKPGEEGGGFTIGQLVSLNKTNSGKGKKKKGDEE